MPSVDSEYERIFGLLTSAFGKLDCPARGDFDRGNSTFDVAEISRVQNQFLGKRWQDFAERPLDVLGRNPGHSTSMCFMSPWVLQYYLPLFLLATAFHNDKREADHVLADLVSLMTPAEGDRGALSERWGLLTTDQIDAAIAALTVIDARHGLSSGADDIEPAIGFLNSLRESAPRS